MSVETLCIHTITIQENTAVPDGKGGNPATWTTKHANIKARIRPIAAREDERWEGVAADLTHTVYIADATLDIKEKDRVVFGSRTFDILGVRDIDEWNRYLQLGVEELR